METRKATVLDSVYKMTDYAEDVVSGGGGGPAESPVSLKI